MDYFYGSPFTGRRLEKQVEFLGRLGLRYDEQAEFSVLVEEGGEVVATGSRQKNVLKCIGTSCRHQGEGLAANVVTQLVKNAVEHGFTHLFLYTSPGKRPIFEELSFYPVTQTADVLFMENVKDGIGRYVRSLEKPVSSGKIGAIVANANPFTFGHLYLVETAAAQCDFLHVFILSEDRSLIPAAARLALAQQCLAHLDNVAVHPTEDYLVSSATFPDYFIKEKAHAAQAYYELDLAVFAQHICPALSITKRFVGEEPLCPVTNGYNEAMLRYLPPRGVAVEVIARKTFGDQVISASRVRELLAQDAFDEIARLVPAPVLHYLREERQKKAAHP